MLPNITPSKECQEPHSSVMYRRTLPSCRKGGESHQPGEAVSPRGCATTHPRGNQPTKGGAAGWTVTSESLWEVAHFLLHSSAQKSWGHDDPSFWKEPSEVRQDGETCWRPGTSVRVVATRRVQAHRLPAVLPAGPPWPGPQTPRCIHLVTGVSPRSPPRGSPVPDRTELAVAVGHRQGCGFTEACVPLQ